MNIRRKPGDDGADDALSELRRELKEFITAYHLTVEEFCWAHELNKATVSNFLNDRKDFRVSTLVQISCAMNRRLKISTEKF